MAPDPARDGYLRLIEARADIGGRYVNLRRVGANGGEGNFPWFLAPRIQRQEKPSQ